MNEIENHINIDNIENDINKILRDMHQFESEKNLLKENITRSVLELSFLSKQYEINLENLKKRQEAILSIKNEKNESEKQIIEYEREMSIKMNIKISDSERLEIKTMSERSQNFQVIILFYLLILSNIL